MYSPRIAEDLIPMLYRIAKAREMPMTRLVDEILRKELGKDADSVDRRRRTADAIKLAAASRNSGVGFRYPRVRDLHKNGKKV